MTFYPLLFEPIFMERIWGGRNLSTLFGKSLPAKGSFGESWEISDRPGAVSNVANGPMAGRDLHWLMQNHPREILGTDKIDRFPLLIKILDAREKLSLQVHPPAEKAQALNGEPKTEMWHVVAADPGAELYVGLKNGVTRETFEESLRNGTVADCFHRLQPRPGETMYLPSGRVHAIGSGLVLFEIQQNSDTTYRVFDWNRVDAEGKPRQLHVRESLECIDFSDFEPGLIPEPVGTGGLLVKNRLFHVTLHKHRTPGGSQHQGGVCQIISLISGHLNILARDITVPMKPGTFCLVPAACPSFGLRADGPCRFLVIAPGEDYVARN